MKICPSYTLTQYFKTLPISNLPHLGKIFDSILTSQMIKFLEGQKFLLLINLAVGKGILRNLLYYTFSKVSKLLLINDYLPF